MMVSVASFLCKAKRFCRSLSFKTPRSLPVWTMFSLGYIFAQNLWPCGYSRISFRLCLSISGSVHLTFVRSEDKSAPFLRCCTVTTFQSRKTFLVRSSQSSPLGASIRQQRRVPNFSSDGVNLRPTTLHGFECNQHSITVGSFYDKSQPSDCVLQRTCAPG